MSPTFLHLAFRSLSGAREHRSQDAAQQCVGGAGVHARQGRGIAADQRQNRGRRAGKANQHVPLCEKGGLGVEQHSVGWAIAADDGTAAHQHGGGTGGQAAPAGGEGFAAQGGGVHAEQMGQLVDDAFEYFRGGDEGDDGFVHALGQAGGGAAGGQDRGSAVFLGGGVRPLDADHGDHVVGEGFAVDALRRGEDTVQVRARGQEIRVGAEVGTRSVLGRGLRSSWATLHRGPG